jgi:hypothetical protein
VVYRRRINSEPSANARFSAETFVGKPDGLGLLPASQYFQIILDGAREHELPGDYQAQLIGTRTGGSSTVLEELPGTATR